METEKISRLAPSAETSVDSASRAVGYVFSDESIGRDGHKILSTAWQTEAFQSNPVFCWQHDSSIPPIGRVFDLHTSGRILRGSVRYAQTEFAETIYALVRGGFLNATSTSWRPISADRMPDGTGLIFTKVDLLEVSQVCVPALPTALASARASGVNVEPLAAWAGAALDSGRHMMARSELLMVRRAASGRSTVSYSLPLTGSGQRAAIARQLIERGHRQNLAALLHARTASELAQAARTSLEEVQGHHARCARRHGELARRHVRLADNVFALSALHRALQRALSASGVADDYGIRKAVADLERCTSSISTDHDGSVSALNDASDALGHAQAGVASIVNGLSTLDEP